MNVEKLMQELAKYPKDAKVITKEPDKKLSKRYHHTGKKIEFNQETNEVILFDFYYWSILEDDDEMYY